jgi:hypothetical protein
MANRDVNPSQGFGATDRQLDWGAEETYWRENWRNRPYVSADRGYEYYQPGYRYGVESAQRYRGRDWNEVEGDLQTGWNRYEHRGQSAWEHVKHAVRDAWDRVAHR